MTTEAAANSRWQRRWPHRRRRRWQAATIFIALGIALIIGALADTTDFALFTPPPPTPPPPQSPPQSPHAHRRHEPSIDENRAIIGDGGNDAVDDIDNYERAKRGAVHEAMSPHTLPGDEIVEPRARRRHHKLPVNYRLYDVLLANYRREARPVRHPSQIVNVSMSAFLYQIFKLVSARARLCDGSRP